MPPGALELSKTASSVDIAAPAILSRARSLAYRPSIEPWIGNISRCLARAFAVVLARDPTMPAQETSLLVR
jgi:hypothetical protein